MKTKAIVSKDNGKLSKWSIGFIDGYICIGDDIYAIFICENKLHKISIDNLEIFTVSR